MPIEEKQARAAFAAELEAFEFKSKGFLPRGPVWIEGEARLDSFVSLTLVQMNCPTRPGTDGLWTCLCSMMTGEREREGSLSMGLYHRIAHGRGYVSYQRVSHRLSVKFLRTIAADNGVTFDSEFK